jgi:beta-N-acetylhexosaminidase
MSPRHDVVVVSVFVRAASASGRMDLAAPLHRLLQDIARQRAAADKPFITTFFGNPYVATFLQDLPAMLLTYDFYDRAELSAVRAIAGEAPISGRLPIALPGMFEAPLAQLDRASGYEPGGRKFESCRARHPSLG